MSEDNKESDAGLLKRLVGCELSAVVFVRDYLQFQFDGPYLTVTTSVVVRIADNLFAGTDQGFKDALVSQIGHTVGSVSLILEEVINLRLDGDREIRISLRPEDRSWIPEAAILQMDKVAWAVYP
jgi:hypothetical protein